MKLLGAGLIWISLIYAGAVYSIKLKKRIILLEKTALMIQEIKIQLEYLNMPVYDMISEIKSKRYLEELSFLGECCKLIESGDDFPSAWENSIENSSLYYKRAEKDKLLHLGANLGKSNAESQISMIEVHQLHFNEFINKAKITKQKYGTLSITIAVLAGCMFFILII